MVCLFLLFSASVSLCLSLSSLLSPLNEHRATWEHLRSEGDEIVHGDVLLRLLHGNRVYVMQWYLVQVCVCVCVCL